MDDISYIVYQDDIKNVQLRVTLGEFKDIEYLHIRKYFLSFEGDWVPSKEGISMPLSISNLICLTDALLDLCAKAEGADLLHKHFFEKLQKLKLEPSA